MIDEESVVAGGRSYWLFKEAFPNGIPPDLRRGRAHAKATLTPRQRARRRQNLMTARRAREDKQRIYDRSLRPPPVDVAALRRKLGMSRATLSRCIAVPVGTLRHWERGDRKPGGAALVLLNLLARNSQATLRALAPRGWGSPLLENSKPL